MATLKLVPSKSFRAPVEILVPGAEPAMVSFDFKHRTLDEFNAFIEESKNKSGEQSKDEVFLMDIVEGWDMAEEFNTTNLRTLCQNYQSAAGAISRTYWNELTKGRVGN